MTLKKKDWSRWIKSNLSTRACLCLDPAAVRAALLPSPVLSEKCDELKCFNTSPFTLQLGRSSQPDSPSLRNLSWSLLLCDPQS